MCRRSRLFGPMACHRPTRSCTRSASFEVGGGALLIAGLATRFASVLLAGDMLGAIVVSGIKQGELISLTLAPALLVVMLFLLWTGSGRNALDDYLGKPSITPPRTAK